jgi:tetratricopeptide (TPR) repeat protein
VWLARGDVLLARKESRADYCFEKAVMLAPQDWVAAWLGARIRCFYRQFALAVKLLQRAVELNTAHFVVWLELGQCQRALGLAGPARHSFEQARQLNPNCREAGLALMGLSGMGAGARLRGWWRRLFNS